MNDTNRQFDKDAGPAAGEKFAQDLRKLFSPGKANLSAVDRAVAEAAHRHLARPAQRLHWVRWAAGIAACLCVTVLGWWVVSGRIGSTFSHKSPVASSGGVTITIESSTSGHRITPGSTIETSSGQTTRLVLNDKHQITLNAETRLSISPLVENDRVGCLVTLASGEVYVHVKRDGNPFVVQTAHGRAVITGTTFDVKASDFGTTLTVVEGSVQFESQKKAVLVAGRQQSTISTASGIPTLPASCDTAILTAWTKSAQSRTQAAQDIPADDSILRDLPLWPSQEVRTDLKSLNYAQWTEQNREWFRQQFPDVFRLQTALASEGIEANYPDLLLESGLLWQFAYPPANQNRLLATEDTPIVKAAGKYERDLQWLKDKGLLPVTTPGETGQKHMAEAFELWGREWAAAESGKEVPKELLLNSLHASVYLRQTRSLLWLAVETDRYSSLKLAKTELLTLLQSDVAVADVGVSNAIQLLAADRSILSCDSNPYRRLTEGISEAVTQLAQNEERLMNETANRPH